MRLGSLIESVSVRCGDSLATVSGVDINKKFITTRANLEGTDTSKYYIVRPTWFACNLMHIGRDERLPIAYNDSGRDIIVTSAYSVFRVKASMRSYILDEYLYLFFSSSEVDRLTWFYTDSSVRGNLIESRFMEIDIPVPSLEKQHEAVSVWKGIRKIKEDNEHLSGPLLQLCQSRIQELKHTHKRQQIGPYISKSGKNSDGRISRVLGIGQNGFMEPQKVPNESLLNYKILSENCICYAPPLYNIKSDAIHLYTDKGLAVCSPIYEVFCCNEKYLLPDYLMLWLKREEFKRYAEFYALGVRNTFNYGLMEEFAIPIPSVEEQLAISNLYRCAREAERISKAADRLSVDICPALIQKVINL